MGYAEGGSEHAKLVLDNLDRDIARSKESQRVHARFNFVYICAAIGILFSLCMLMGELGYREGYTGPQWAPRRNHNSNYYERYDEGGMYERPGRTYYREGYERAEPYQRVHPSHRQRQDRWR